MKWLGFGIPGVGLEVEEAGKDLGELVPFVGHCISSRHGVEVCWVTV